MMTDSVLRAHDLNAQVHDVQLDYYGRRLATCSSDHTIKIFDMAGDQLTHVSGTTWNCFLCSTIQ